MEYLSIGTIVFTKTALFPFVIIGYREVDKKICYTAVAYPNGFSSMDTAFIVEPEAITKVIFNGYKNEKFNEYNEYLLGKNPTYKFLDEEEEK